MEEESAFSFVTQRNKNKHKKKRVPSEVSDADIKDLVLKKKKELAHNSSNGLAQKKKRKQDALEDKPNELWQTFEILNPSKKMKKNKVTKSIFSNCNISEGTPNLFFNSDSNKNSKNNDSSKDPKKRKKQFLACSTPKPVENDKSQESSKKKKSKKKQTPSINGSDGVNAVKSKPFEVKTVKIPKSVRADSVQVGENVFGWMISPFDVQEFFTHVWEKKPLHVVRNDENFFDGICSVQDFDGALRRNDVYFNKNIDVTSYVNGERSTENVSGKARPAIVWSFYEKGRSIRMLNPQTFIPNVATLITSLQVRSARVGGKKNFLKRSRFGLGILQMFCGGQHLSDSSGHAGIRSALRRHRSFRLAVRRRKKMVVVQSEVSRGSIEADPSD